MAKRGIRLVYTDQLKDINADNLANYDALLLYANIDEIDPPQEQALLDYVNRRRRICAAALRDVLLSQLRRNRRLDGCPIPAARHRRVSHED